MEIKKFKGYQNKLPNVYLAGGWDDWRDTVIDKIGGVNFLDPRIVTSKDKWFEEEVSMVRQSDAVIAWCKKDNPSGFGMTFEMGVAYGLNKPYVLINEKENDYQWGMQTRGSVKTFKNFDEFCVWVNDTNWMGMYLK